VVWADIFVPADGDPYVMGGADTASVPAFEVEGTFAASYKNDCGFSLQLELLQGPSESPCT
jgi:hypothetical protein